MRKFVLILVLSITAVISHAQSIETEFGKNRVQYHDDFDYWSKYETNNFIVYWYGKGRNIGQFAAQVAEMDHNEIRKVIEHKINDKIEILVYVDVSDLKQSNLGIEEAFVSKSGETKIVGNKMFVYFDGNHQNLRKKIREGIASVYFSAMMFGANFQEIIQNAVLLEVPDWFAQGIISYAGSQWNIFIEDELRDILYRDKKYGEFRKLAEEHPRVAGHALWYYIGQNYGKSAISNLLYLTRISRDVENAFQFVLNTSLEQVSRESDLFFRQKFSEEKGVFDLLQSRKKVDLSNKKEVPVSAMALSPDGRYLLYAYNQIGKVRLRLKDLKTGDQRTVFRKGFKNAFQETDYDFPHLVWNESGSEFSYTYLHRDKMYLKRYDLATGEETEQLIPEIIQRIYSIAYLDERYYVLSASIDGFSDLFIYDSKIREVLPITSDYFDDVDAVVCQYKGEKGILFASNRLEDHFLPTKMDTLLPIGHFDLFFWSLEGFTEKKDLPKLPKLVERLTDTPDENERYPIVQNDKVLFLNDRHGVINTFVLSDQAPRPYAVSNFGRNVIRHHVSGDGRTYMVMLYNEGGYEVHAYDHDTDTPHQIFTTRFRKQWGQTEEENQELEAAGQDEFEPGMQFQSKFADPDPLPEIDEESTTRFLPFLNYSMHPSDQGSKKVQPFNVHRIVAAGLRFKLANVTTRLDNEVLFGGLELFEGQNPQVNQLPMGFLAKATVNDLFEDYSFEGGVRFPTSFNGSEYFAFFDNRKKLIDRRIGLYRRSLTENSTNENLPQTRSKKETILGMYQWRYPFDIYSSIRATASLRFDRSFFKATETASLEAPIGRDKRLGFAIEYVFDNSLDYHTNIKHGSRAKAYVEMYNQFDVNLIDGFDFDYSKGFTAIIGFDGRHYIPVLKHAVWASRFAGATSLGSKKNVYMLGDVNNTVIPGFDNSIPIPDDRNFAFKTNINHLRGFRSNIRNGSSFLVGNTELRIPIFRYFLDKDKGAAFFRDFQVIGFGDAGLAWYGLSPYSDENLLNTVFIENPVAQIEVKYYRDPLVLGYGFGFRTTLLGYFIRVDRAWGIETRSRQEAKWHISFGFDF